jgi:hypothetical protein
MTIDQQPSDIIRDRFDRATQGAILEPDLAAAISNGRRRRRRTAISYAAGSLAVAAVAASTAYVAIPHGSAPDRGAPATSAVVDDGTFVPGTTIDTDLAAAVAAADPSLPAPTDVYPSDWSRDTPLPADEFANATEWQLVYELSPEVELLVYVGKPIPGVVPDMTCRGEGQRVVKPSDGTTTVDVPGTDCTDWQVGADSMIAHRQVVGDPGHERYWFATALSAPDGRFVNVMEKVQAANWKQAAQRRQLPADAAVAIASASGLDFPDPVDPPSAP